MEYESIFKEQQQPGIMQQVPVSQERAKECHFLPHHGVVRQDKETTKLRIVFDESAKSRECSSLNDCLDKGPILTSHILNVLLSFCVQRVGLIADIEKAFHQIIVKESDCDFL